jgi:purine/pyrimidine-nucleoside phosphorylase
MLKTNSYFEGRVMSIAFQSETLPATVGVMEPGEYEFPTGARETVTVISGALIVKLPDTDAWQTFTQGEIFEVAANVRFQVRVGTDSAYLCTYG